MKILTDTSYKENFEPYTEIHYSIPVTICHIETTRRDMMLKSDLVVILYKEVLGTAVQGRHVTYTSSASRAFVVSDNFFDTLGIIDNYPEKNICNK